MYIGGVIFSPVSNILTSAQTGSNYRTIKSEIKCNVGKMAHLNCSLLNRNYMQLDSLGDPFYAQIWEIKNGTHACSRANKFFCLILSTCMKN